MDSPQTDEIIDDNLENFERQEQIITIPIIKYPQKVEKKPTKLLDFQLCFPINTTDLGRSYVSLHRPIGYKSTIPSKFYSKYEVQDDKSLSTEDIQKNIENLLGKPPYKKYKRPVTENHRYGWYQALYTEFNKPNPIGFFGKDTSFEVQFRILEISQDETLEIKKKK